MRKLASVQRVENLQPIEGADFIESAKILGWNVVVKRGDFKVGDLAYFFEIDSLLPLTPEFDFINKDSKGEYLSDSSRRIRTKKLKKVLSQGLAKVIPLCKSYKLGDDVTEEFGVTKYEPPVHSGFAGSVKSTFPIYVPKTDEERIQNIPNIFSELEGKQLYTSVKLDGTSSTFSIKDGVIDVCSRNQSLKETPPTIYWAIEKKYRIVEKFKFYGRNIALQGEICGPSIQKNRLNLKECDLFLFDVYLIDEQKYGDLELLRKISVEYEIPMVPIENDHFFTTRDSSVESLLKMAEGIYDGTQNEREGLVIRPIVYTKSSIVGRGRLSFKVVSNKYLLKGGE
jgi:RNA ligase (TIGR02306 family)